MKEGVFLTESIFEHIKQKKEIKPDEHDGSYELVRETVRALSRVDKDELDYKDMNLLYFMTVGTFTKVSNLANKRKRIEESHIREEDKQKLKDLLNRIMEDVRKGKYENIFSEGSIGMFGSGFGSFIKFETHSKKYGTFIEMCTKILDEEDEEKIFEIAEGTLKEPIPGLGIAAVSQILHCLKPNVFPILNQKESAGIAVYKKLGIDIIAPQDPTKYIENTRRIKEFRDRHFNFKNYRVFDIALCDFKPQKLVEPFKNIFSNIEEAHWFLDFVAKITTQLNVQEPEDPRLAASLRHGGKTLRFVFCNWVLASFHQKENKSTVELPLIKSKARDYETYYYEDFAHQPGGEKLALYSLPFEKCKELEENYPSVIEDSLGYISLQFQNYKRSPHRNRKSHIQELIEMVFDPEKRKFTLENGLNVESREKVIPNIWWVNQNKNLEQERDGGYLWAGKKGKKGQSVYHWETLKDVEKGDIILHYSKGKLEYVSQVIEKYRYAPPPSPHDIQYTGQEGRLIKTEYHKLTPPIPLTAIGHKLAHIDIQHGPIDNTGGIVEGYLFRFNEDALKIIQKAQPETKWPDFAIFVEYDSYTFDNLIQDTYMDEQEIMRIIKAIERKRQAIIYGPPGTGKTYIAKKLASYLTSDGEGSDEIVQFHPAYSYEDFIQGIRPQVREDNLLEYNLVPGRFMEFCERAGFIKDPCVLIIDEINRANLSRVFGELMYLLEYRNEKMFLAGGRTLEIPPNVYIIGTMNTADRSIALVDYALRRRFAFLKLNPNYEVIRRFHKERGLEPEKLIEVLKQLNEEIGDSHYAVGHSFFLVENLPEQIKDIWEMEIYPYLEEYFFDQPEKANIFTWNNVKDRLGLW